MIRSAIKLIIANKKEPEMALFLFCPKSHIFLLNIDDGRIKVNKRNLEILNKSFKSLEWRKVLWIQDFLKGNVLQQHLIVY